MKNKALLLLKVAVELFPPLAALIGEAISKIGDDHPDKALVDEVREILPSQTPLHDILKKLQDE